MEPDGTDLIPAGFVPFGYSSSEASNYNQYAGYAAQAAYNNNISVPYFLQLLQNESAFNPNAQNPNSSAAGIAQFVSGTAAGYEVGGQPLNPLNPLQSIDAAASYVGDLVGNAIGNGQSIDQAYATAAQQYGDTASNNPNAATFNTQLMAALNYGGSNTMTASNSSSSNPLGQAFSNFELGAYALANLGNTQSGVPQAIGSVASSATNSVTSGIGSAISSAISPITSLFSNANLERLVLIIGGILLLGAALFTLVKSYGNSNGSSPPVVLPIPA